MKNKILILIIITTCFFLLLENKDEEIFFEPISESVQDKVFEKPVARKLERTIVRKIKVANKPLKREDSSFAKLDSDGNLYVTKVFNDGEYLTFHGDIILASSEDLYRLSKNKTLIHAKPQIWNDGVIPYKVDSEITNPSEITNAIKYFEDKTNVKFVKHSSQDDYLTFVPGKMNCYSALGKIGGPQVISLHPNCKIREIVHEIMHTLGFIHEHSRADRDEHLDINWNNIAEENQIQFKKIGFAFSLVKSERPFDYDSIMLYPSQAFSMFEGEYSLVKRDGDLIHTSYSILSAEDILRVNSLYPAKNN